MEDTRHGSRFLGPLNQLAKLDGVSVGARRKGALPAALASFNRRRRSGALQASLLPLQLLQATRLVDLAIALAAAEARHALLTRDRDFEPIAAVLGLELERF